MQISIIIPTYNRPEQLIGCLQKLHPDIQQVDREHYEIIITDDGNINATQTILNDHLINATCYKGPSRGPAANRNNGAKYAKGEWLIFLDDDCIPSESLIKSYSRYIQERPDISVFEGAIHPIGKKTRMDEEAPINMYGGYLWSCNFCIKKSVFIESAGFNEAFPYACMEDVDLQSRLKKSHNIHFADKSVVFHEWRRVENISLKWNRVYESHKIFIQVNPFWREYFSATRMFKLLLLSFTKGTLIDSVKFNGKGIGMNLAFHQFQIKMLIFLIKKYFKG